MASLTNTKIKNTYVSLLKVADNGQLDAALQDITDGAGNVTGVQLNTGGDLAASGTVSFGSLKDTGENITISKFVDAADGIGSNNNDTTIPTSAAVATYVAAQITAEDLDFAGDTGTGAVDLDSQTLTIAGTANEIETSATGQTLTIGLPSTINVNVSGNLTGTVTSASVLQDGVTATTQLTSDNSTKVATTAFVKSVLTLENLDIAGTSGTGSVDLDSQVLTIAGTTNEIETNASGQTITVGLPSDVTIGNNLTVTTNATVGGTFGVTGATGVDGDFDVNTNKFTVQAATGNTSVAGTLGVTGNTTLSTVDVTGLASLDGGIDVDGAFTVADTSGNISTSGTLGVTGTSTLGVINASGLASLDGGIDVDGAFTVADTTGNVSTTGSITAATGTINGLLDVVGEVQATFLDINGNGELSGNFAVDTDTLFVDSVNDRVGVNKTNPAVALDVTGDITSSGTITGTTLAGTLSTAAQTNITSVGTLSSLAVSGNLTVDTDTLYVDAAANRVGINESSPSVPLHVNGATSNDLAIFESSDANASIVLNDDTGKVRFRQGSGVFFIENDYDNTAAGSDIVFSIDNSEKVRIDSSGNVGIGTSSPSMPLTVKANVSRNAIQIINGGSATEEGRLYWYASDASTIRAAIGGDENALRFFTGSSVLERMRIDSSGNVGIGTSSPNISGFSKALTIDSSSSGIELSSSGTVQGAIGANANGLTVDGIGAIGIRFNTSSSGSVSERMRITSGGYLKASNTGSYGSFSASTSYEFHSSTSNYHTLGVLNSSGSPYGQQIVFNGASPNNTTNFFIFASDSTESKFIVYSNGNVVNRNNSYGAISDAKLKENVKDASPKLDDLLQVKVRNFNYIGDDKKQLGVVAQELEEVFPSMIDESPDYEDREVEVKDEEGNIVYKTEQVLVSEAVLDEEGNVIEEAVYETVTTDEPEMTTERVDLGTTTKSVKYSVFVPMLIKAMQEQQEIINDLKARIETLEAK